MCEVGRGKWTDDGVKFLITLLHPCSCFEVHFCGGASNGGFGGSGGDCVLSWGGVVDMVEL